MSGIVQWGIDELYRGLQQLKNGITQVRADLNADKLQLQQLYAIAKQEYDPAGAYDRAALDKLIHQNTVLRLSYLKPLIDRFNEAARIASNAIRNAGYNAPSLSGLGFVVVLAPAAAVAIVVLALAALGTVTVLTQSQRQRTAAMASIFTNPSTSVEEKAALAAAFERDMEAERKAHPPLAGIGDLVPLAALLALLLLVPPLMREFKPRKVGA